MRSLLTAIAAVLVLAGSSAAQTPAVAIDFEQGAVGAQPTEWLAAGNGYSSALDPAHPHGGKLSLRLQRNPDAGDRQQFGTSHRGLDAKPYRGKRIRYSAYARVVPGVGQRAGLWLRIDRTDGKPGFLDIMDDRPITAQDWQVYEIEASVPLEAERMNFGVQQRGAGTVWIDNASIEVVGPAIFTASTAPLTAQGQRNLQAFARLYGYVRWFHPSEEGAKADWDALAIAGVQRVEGARNSKQLAQALREIFLPVAPTLVIDPGAPAPPAISTVPTTDLLAWTHIGVQMTPDSSYRSFRTAPPAGMAPDAAVSLDLGQGVTARMRLVLPTGAPAATLPLLKPRRSDTNRFDGDDRSTRLANVVIAWNVFQHFYPYFDVVKVDWSAELPKALASAATDKDGDAFQITLRRLVAALRDGHGAVWRPGPLGRLPVFWTWVEGKMVITDVIDQPDLRVGDIVLTVNGQPAAERLEANASLVSSPTPQWRLWRSLDDLAWGKPDSTVTLTVQHADGTTGEAVLTYRLPGKDSRMPGTEARPGPITELQPGLLYVDLTRAKAADLVAAQSRLVEARAVIFDVRGRPTDAGRWLVAHLSDQTLYSAKFERPVVTRPDRQGWSWKEGSWTIPPEAPRIPGKLVFITDGRAISYAESVLGVVEGHKLGEIVGGPTAGSNGDNQPFRLPGGYIVGWTGLRVTKHDGSSHHGVGILPTVPTERTLAGIRGGRDELLEAAIRAAGF